MTTTPSPTTASAASVLGSKVEARGQYHAGPEVLLKFENVVIEGDVARAVYDLDGSETVAVVGRIRYDSIVQIDWAGDEYYGQPHVYCSFDHGGEPYESVELYRPYGDAWREHLDGVKFKDRGTKRWQLPSLFRDWRLHREMLRAQRSDMSGRLGHRRPARSGARSRYS